MAHKYATARSGGRMPPLAPSHKRGAWKLAYADFLTALCAFFLVMWMINTPQSDREGVAEYFSGDEAQSVYTSARPAKSEEIAAILASSAELEAYQDNISIRAADTFVRLDLFDTSNRPLFENGLSGLNEAGTDLVHAAGTVVAENDWFVSVEGHTDSTTIHRKTYSNWDLSAERANAARRMLEESGVNSANFRAVTGLADTRPLLPNATHLPANRRISIVIHLID